MELVNIDVKTFKKEVYKSYKKMFPRLERKSYNQLKKCDKLGMVRFIKVVDEEKFIGYAIINTISEVKYIQLDYLVILPQYQDMGYGTKTLELLKKEFMNFDGIFVEVEKLGLGKDDNENKQRIRRDKFYKNIGFIPLDYEFYLHGVIYTPYILFTKDDHEEEQEIVEDMFKLYYKTVCLSKTKSFNKHCRYKKLTNEI